MYGDVYCLVYKYQQTIKDHQKCKETLQNEGGQHKQSEGDDPVEIEIIQRTEDIFFKSLVVTLRKIQENNAFIKHQKVMLKQ